MLQCALIVCCSALQCVAVYVAVRIDSVLQCVAVCCSVYVAVRVDSAHSHLCHSAHSRVSCLCYSVCMDVSVVYVTMLVDMFLDRSHCNRHTVRVSITQLTCLSRLTQLECLSHSRSVYQDSHT